MQLAVGSSLTRYVIAAPLGRGGMGEVYRARDTNLGRDVAIKVLPPELVADPERLVRFRKEAQFLAALNHPRIAAIHGLEEADGTPFLVMELVEGEDLAARIARGAIPAEEAADLARQLAEALEAAHERGIVHRDLKPANLMLTPDGGLKVLDFGLAKMFTDQEAAAGSSDLANSPTIARNLTQAGVILGTAAYMSPEQARGKSVDKRSDIWSFGVVLFEMLSGRQLFRADTVSDMLAAVLREEIDWSRLPADSGPHMQAVVRRCLDRNPASRLRDIGEARIALTGASSLHQESSLPVRVATRSHRLWLIGALLAAGAASFLTWRLKPDAPRRVIRASIQLPAGQSLSFGLSAPPNVAISPDGSTIAFAAIPEGRDRSEGQVYLRRLDAREAVLIPGSRGARSPFFPPMESG